MKKLILLSLLTIFIFSCGNDEGSKEKAALPKWLEGEWITKEDSMTFIEKWTMSSDSLFAGRGIAMKGNDTVFNEQLEIRCVDDTLYYVPTVSNQNDGKSVWFKITRLDSTGFLAENQLHDFPKTIDYRLKGKDSLYAILKGMENGKIRTEIFPMKRK